MPQVERERPDSTYMTKRSPAWCDRVLVRSNLPHKQASCVDYYSVPAIATSDHKPVGALIRVSRAALRLLWLGSRSWARCGLLAVEALDTCLGSRALWLCLHTSP